MPNKFLIVVIAVFSVWNRHSASRHTGIVHA